MKRRKKNKKQQVIEDVKGDDLVPNLHQNGKKSC